MAEDDWTETVCKDGTVIVSSNEQGTTKQGNVD